MFTHTSGQRILDLPELKIFSPLRVKKCKLLKKLDLNVPLAEKHILQMCKLRPRVADLSKITLKVRALPGHWRHLLYVKFWWGSRVGNRLLAELWADAGLEIHIWNQPRRKCALQRQTMKRKCKCKLQGKWSVSGLGLKILSNKLPPRFHGR